MLCCILIIFCLGTSMHTASEAEVIHRPRVDLRSYIESLTPDECIAFLEENGLVKVPYFYAADDNSRLYAKGIVLDICDDPSAHMMVGRVEAYNFYEGVRNLLKWHKFAGYDPAVDAYVL